MILIYILIVFINSIILYPTLDEYFSFSLWVSQYVYGGGEDLFSFVLIFILIGLALLPVYRKIEEIFFVGRISRTKREVFVYRLLTISLSVVVSMFMFSIVSIMGLSDFIQYLLTFNTFVFIMLYLFSYRTQLESIIKDVFNYSTTRKYYIDTSVLIDGRFNLIVPYITGNVVVPDDVITELHKLSDFSDDLIKRRKGQKGLKNLSLIKETKGIEVENVDIDRELRKTKEVKGQEDVDNLLVKYILKEGKDSVLVTNDYNLTLVGEGKGIKVLNINKLNNDLKIDVEEGDKIEVIISKKGSRAKQGIGTLEDGTMVLVDNAEQLVGKKVEAIVYKKHNTESGCMLFSKIV